MTAGVTTPVIVAAIAAGALGALLRYGVAHAARSTSGRVPRAVLAVNVAASFVAGLAIALAPDDPGLRLIVVSGFAGGLSTFSTFSVETVQLAIDGRWRTAVASVLANLVGGLLAVTAGWGLAVLLGA